MTTFHCFTARANGIMRTIETACHVGPAFDPKASAPAQYPQLHEFRAIWDTGATASAISQEVVDKCQLMPIGFTTVHGVHGPDQAEVYLVNIGLPNGVGFPQMQVTKAVLGGAQVLIGMDILTRGDFALTNHKGKTVVTFRSPSMEVLDFNTPPQAARPWQQPPPPRSGGSNYTPPKKKKKGRSR